MIEAIVKNTCKGNIKENEKENGELFFMTLQRKMKPTVAMKQINVDKTF
jgi:hypothetical protein